MRPLLAITLTWRNLEHNDGCNSNNASHFHGLQGPITLVEQAVGNELKGEFPERISLLHSWVGLLACSPAKHSHSWASRDSILVIFLSISSVLMNTSTKSKGVDGFSARSGIGHPTGREARKPLNGLAPSSALSVSLVYS